MDLRIALASLLLASASAIAQEKPTDPPATDPTGQGPATQEPNEGAVIAELRREKERLLKEIAYAKDRAANARKILIDKLGSRGQTFDSIDAGVNRPVAPQPVAMLKASLMEEAQLAALEPSVIMTVDGLPVHQREFDELFGYLAGLPNSGTDDIRAQRVTFELIRVKSVQAAFPENDVEGLVSEVVAKLQEGKPMTELVKTYGTVIGAKEDGSLEVTRNSFLGTGFEAVAFALKEGERSRPFRNVFGLVIFEANEIVKGENEMLDKVVGHAVQVRYFGEQSEIQAAQSRASRGQASIHVRDESVMQKLPMLYRPVSDNQMLPASDPVADLEKQLAAVRAALTKVRQGAADRPDIQARIKQLENQEKSLLEAIERVRTRTVPRDDMQAPDAGASDRPRPVVPVKPVKQTPPDLPKKGGGKL